MRLERFARYFRFLRLPADFFERFAVAELRFTLEQTQSLLAQADAELAVQRAEVELTRDRIQEFELGGSPVLGTDGGRGRSASEDVGGGEDVEMGGGIEGQTKTECVFLYPLNNRSEMILTLIDSLTQAQTADSPSGTRSRRCPVVPARRQFPTRHPGESAGRCQARKGAVREGVSGGAQAVARSSGRDGENQEREGRG